MTEAVKKTKTGYDPNDEDILYGPINNPNQLRHVSDLVSRAPAHAGLLAGGKQQGSVGFFYEPTLIADLDQDDELVETEVFGPVVTAQRFNDEDGAVRFANGSEYGLASSVWTSNGIVRLVIGAAEVDDLGVDTPEGDQRGRGVVQGPPVSGGDHRALRMAVSPLPAELP